MAADCADDVRVAEEFAHPVLSFLSVGSKRFWHKGFGLWQGTCGGVVVQGRLVNLPTPHSPLIATAHMKLGYASPRRAWGRYDFGQILSLSMMFSRLRKTRKFTLQTELQQQSRI